MSNYNTQLQSNNIDLQTVLQTLQTKAAGGEQAQWSANEDAIINRTLSSYTNDRVTSIRGNVFNGCSRLETVSFPICTNIGYMAFAYCDYLASVSFPVCTSISDSAFTGCSGLTEVNFPSCTTIEREAFANCRRLASANFPVCTSISGTVFRNCYALKTLSFPSVEIIGNSAFYSCSSLTTASFPACTSIGSQAFARCSALITLSLPSVEIIGNSAFYSCYSLTTVNFPACTSIGSSVFFDCWILSSVFLGASSVCTLKASNAFWATPYTGYSTFFSGTPYIYVPSSLITTYQSATNWAYFSSYFSSIESLSGTNMITFTIDGTEYQAEEGMTWGEWYDSEYNTSSLIDWDGSGYTDESYSVVLRYCEDIDDHLATDSVYFQDIIYNTNYALSS